MNIDHPEYAELIRRVKSGESVPSVARALGLSQSWAYKVLQGAGRGRRVIRKLPREQLDAIVRSLLDGATAVSVAAAHQMSTRTVSDIAARAGISVAQLRSERRAANAMRKREQRRALLAMSTADADAYLARAVAMECEPAWRRAEMRSEAQR